MAYISFDNIPDFSTPIYEHLLNILQKGACIFFGAGISKIAGYKLWDELKIKMVDFYWNKKHLISNDDSRHFDFSFCQNLKEHQNTIETFDYLYMLDSNLFILGMKSIFESDEQNSNHRIFKSLAKLDNGNSIFITTNIDKGFQNCLSIKDQNTSIFPLLNNPPKKISYVHGRIDYEDTWVFTRNQYNKGYNSDNSPCLKFLNEIFSSYSIIFFGYGLQEPEILAAVAKTKGKKRHYWIEHVSRTKLDYMKIRSSSLLESCRITLVPYSIENDGHGATIGVIDSLSKAIHSGN